jgi:hypothetical protein
MNDLTEDIIAKFLKEVMDIERRYANEHKNKNSARQSEIKDFVEKFVAKELK